VSWTSWPLVILNPDSSPFVPFGPLIAAVLVSLLGGLGAAGFAPTADPLARASDLVHQARGQ
jgi:uncharacterized protein